VNVLAPVVMFVYDRPEHTMKSLKALQKNKLSNQSDLYIYSDAAKDRSSQIRVEAVRDVISRARGFRSVTIIERSQNLGLAQSIINGVSEQVQKYGRIIVLEDDLITSPFFLTYMNGALDYFEEVDKVWHVSGWNYPIDPAGLGDVYLWRAMNCWGWGTWANRWQFFEKDHDELVRSLSRRDIHRFNLDGAVDFWWQVLANRSGKINTWAVFWYATIFKRSGLCLNPAVTFIENIGLDGSGTHCLEEKTTDVQLSELEASRYHVDIQENQLALSKIQDYYRSNRQSVIGRVGEIIKKLFGDKGA
jgi:hypothetical protein